MYRLRVVPIFLPPLRERREDVEVLAWHFIRRRNLMGRRRVESVSAEAMRALMDYGWPGNVRELANAIAYAFAVSRGAEIGLDDLPPELRQEGLSFAQPGAADASATDASEAPAAMRDATRRKQIIEALRLEGGHLGRAAGRLNVSRATLWRWRKRLGI